MTIAATTDSGDYRKSSFSGPNTNCVEVHCTRDRLRDSKNPSGPTLPVAGLPTFIDLVKQGDITPTT